MNEACSEFNIDDDNTAEMLGIVRALRLANSFKVLFAQCNSSAIRDGLMEQAEKLLGRRVWRMRVPNGSARLLNLLSDVPQNVAGVFVYGLED